MKRGDYSEYKLGKRGFSIKLMRAKFSSRQCPIFVSIWKNGKLLWRDTAFTVTKAKKRAAQAYFDLTQQVAWELWE